MNSFDREQYLKQLRMYYAGDRDDIEQFLEDMSDSLDCYLKDYPSATVAEIFRHFGHPKELQEQYEEAVYKQHSRRKKLLLRILTVLVCTACILIFGAFVIHSHNVFIEVHGHANIFLEEADPDNTIAPTTPSSNSFFHIKE